MNGKNRPLAVLLAAAADVSNAAIAALHPRPAQRQSRPKMLLLLGHRQRTFNTLRADFALACELAAAD